MSLYAINLSLWGSWAWVRFLAYSYTLQIIILCRHRWDMLKHQWDCNTIMGMNKLSNESINVGEYYVMAKPC